MLARLARRADAPGTGWDGPAPHGGLVMEVAGTHRVSQRTAEGRLGDARHLVDRLPATLAALADGRLFLSHARVLVNETLASSPEVCARVEREVLPASEHLMPAELRKRVRKAVIAADPVTAQEQHEQERQEREAWVKPAPNGMALLGAYVEAVQGRRFDGDLTALLGACAFAEDDPRTEAQRRADLVADLPGLAMELVDRMNGVLPPLGAPSLVARYLPDTPSPAGNRATRRRRRRTQVVVQVPVDTALEFSCSPVWLDGYGWITAEQGCALLTEAELRKACLDPRTGRLLALSRAVAPGVAVGEPVCSSNPAVFGGDVDALVEAFHAAQQAAWRAQSALRDALEAEGMATPEAVEAVDALTGPCPPAPDGRAVTSRPAPPDADDVAAQVRRLLLGMVVEPTVVDETDPAVRVEPQHDPSEAVREFVDLRDAGCDGPGCSTPATCTDLDHEDPWPRGRTTAGQLRNRSRRCHGAKHHGWQVQVDDTGWSTWTSPGGRTYRRPPRHDPPPLPPAPVSPQTHRVRRQEAPRRDPDDPEPPARA